MPNFMFFVFSILVGLWGSSVQAIDYEDALQKCLLFFEGQRSGPLPATQRVEWRGDSGLLDGFDVGVDLVGGYYDAGDNVKFGVPMAFTATLLSWGMIEYGEHLRAAGQLDYTREATKWITDYLLKAITGPTQLWVQVADPNLDHDCWERPEDMDTSRQSYQINPLHPGSEPAAETAAALASTAIVFQTIDIAYSEKLLTNAVQVRAIGKRTLGRSSVATRTAPQMFDFADKYRASYGDACPFYCSYSGYTDELLWGAAWLYKATGQEQYLEYVKAHAGWSYTMSEFLWDNKLGGLQVLLSKLYFEGHTDLASYKSQADAYICENLPESPQRTVKFTPGGLLFFQETNNLQYVTATAFLFMIYSDYLVKTGLTLNCGGRDFTSDQLYNFAKSQIDYALGSNPLNMSFMVGFGEKYPNQLHHRGASIVSIHEYPAFVGCREGYTKWFYSPLPNPNVHTGAVVGGANKQDAFQDQRGDWNHLEPMTYLNAAMVAPLAKIIGTNL